MKNFKFLLSLVLVAGLTLAGCSSGGNDTSSENTDNSSGQQTDEKKEITLMQNKPEIDAQLKAFVATYEEETGVKINVKSCGGDSCQLGTQLKADIAAGDAPDIFVIDGVAAYEEYKDLILSLDGEPWVSETSVAFENEGTVYGFPVFIEGWGLGYNADLLAEAGIDPTTLTNYDAYVAAFEKLDSMKEELGLGCGCFNGGRGWYGMGNTRP
ncbi:MAG TPA: hypothetical protein DCY20_05800 [Firmicutes bacterium]|nr:hypothetical protein [Bacillota bacterium]